VNRSAVAIMCICMGISTVMSSCKTSRQTNKIALIFREGASSDLELMLTKELGVMKQMLEKEGFEVAIASTTAEPVFSRTAKVQPDLKLADVNPDDYCGIIIPCMALGMGPAMPEAVDIVKRAAAKGKPVAGQVSAVFVLGVAGVLKGKKYAQSTEVPKYTEGFKDAIYAGNGVVQDGNIITSGVCPFIAKRDGLPDNTVKFTQTFIAELKRRK
jgi:putative intracellular protease/amidase